MTNWGAETRGWTLDVLQVVRALVEEREAGRAGFAAQPKEAAPLQLGGEMQECRPKGTALHWESSAKRTPPQNTFTLDEVYAHAEELAKLHPDNRHVRDKIRQQLQVFAGHGIDRVPRGGAVSV